MERQSNLPFFLRYTRLNAGVLFNSEGCTFNKVEPKYRFTMLNEDNTKVCYTDANLKKRNRDKKLNNFMEHFNPQLESGKISVIALIVYADTVPKFSNFVKYFKFKRLKKLEIKTYGHIYVCDVGNKELRPHYHLFIAVSPINKEIITKLFPKSKHHRYKGILMDNSFALIPYCIKKELFAKPSGFTFRTSKIFKSPTQNLIPIL